MEQTEEKALTGEVQTIVLPDEIAVIASTVSEGKRNEVAKVLNDIFSKTAEWKTQVDNIKIVDINDKVNIKMAEVARKNAKDYRLATEKLFDAKRDELKQSMSNFKKEDDLWLKTKQIMQIKLKAIEEKAEYKAKFEERYHAEQKELRTQMRLAKCQVFSDQVSSTDISELSDITFDIYINGLEMQHKAKLQKIQDEENERLRLLEIQELNNSRKTEILELYQYVSDEYKACNYGELDLETWEKVKGDAIVAKNAFLQKQQ